MIISGLPLNNFTPQQVEQILNSLWDRLVPGGYISFFEYIAIRRIKSLICGRKERQRLSQVGNVLTEFLRRETRRETALANLPPAWVHHLRKEPVKT